MKTFKLFALVAVGLVAVNADSIDSALTDAHALDAIQVQQVAHRTKEEEALLQANQAVDAAQKLISVAGSTSEASQTVASTIGPVLSLLKNLGPALGAAGFVLTIVGIFQESEHDKVMGAISRVSEQVDSLGEDMNKEFKNLAAANYKTSCYDQIDEHELRILGGVNYLKQIGSSKARDNAGYRNQLISEFNEHCSGNSCNTAASTILSTLLNRGVSSCDLLDMLYVSHKDSEGNLAEGNKDNLARLSAYYMAVVQMGISVQSAYSTLKASGDGKVTAYQVTSDLFMNDVRVAADKINSKIATANRDRNTNTKNHWNRILSNSSRRNTKESQYGERARKINQIMNAQYSDYRWGTVMYGSISGADNHNAWSAGGDRPYYTKFRHSSGFSVITMGLPKACSSSLYTSKRVDEYYRENTKAGTTVSKVNGAGRGLSGVLAIKQHYKYGFAFADRFNYKEYNAPVKSERKTVRVYGWGGWVYRQQNVPQYKTKGFTWNC